MENLEDYYNSVMSELVEKAAAAGRPIRIPPPFFETLGMKITAFEPGQRVSAEFPFDARYANPLGIYLGGMTCALIDAVMGPLSYTAAKGPALTTEFTISYMRPFTPADERILVDTWVIAQSRQLILMEGMAQNPAGKLIAKARSTSLIPN